MFVKQDNHWIPEGFHGVVPYPVDGDIQKAVQAAVKKLLPRQNRTMSVISGKYIVMEGPPKQLVFEIDE